MIPGAVFGEGIVIQFKEILFFPMYNEEIVQDPGMANTSHVFFPSLYVWKVIDNKQANVWP